MKKYDWLFIIADKDLDREFFDYCKQHKKVKSIKRLARSFVVGRKIKRWPCYEVGKTEPFDNWACRIAQESWL